MSWTQKYRPTTLSEVLGNEYMLEKLRNMIILDNLPQALMFIGEAGVGKTSTARLLSATLMCNSRLEDGSRCMSCRTCTALTENLIKKGEVVQGVPIFQYDIAKLNKREDISKIVELIQQRLLHNQKTIFILDEIQQASPEAQSCFLKVIEEPPKNVFIFLCTTNPEKLIAPLRSRFHQINVRKPNKAQLTQHLQYICIQEGINHSFNAVDTIASKYQCVPREAIKMLEFIALTGDVTKDNVYKELSLVQDQHYQTFFNACTTGNLTRVMQMVELLNQEARIDVATFVRGLGVFVTDMLRVRAGITDLRYTTDELKAMRAFIRRFSDKQIADMLIVFEQAGNQAIITEFTLTALAVKVTEIIVDIPTMPVPTEVEVSQNYTQVTMQVMEQESQRTLTDASPATAESLLDVFGIVQSVNLPSGV